MLMFLQAVSDDILFIQSQNRGLQVQTQNQRALLGEIQNLLVSLSSWRRCDNCSLCTPSAQFTLIKRHFPLWFKSPWKSLQAFSGSRKLLRNYTKRCRQGETQVEVLLVAVSRIIYSSSRHGGNYGATAGLSNS